MNIDKPTTQGEFAELVGCSQPTVSRMVRDGLLTRRGTLRAWIRAYVATLEDEREALAGSSDDSTETRAARLALTVASTRLKEQQARMLVKEYETSAKRYTNRMLGEIQAVLYRQIPNAVVSRLLAIIPKQEDRYAAVDAFREIVADAVARVMQGDFDEDGLFVDGQPS